MLTLPVKTEIVMFLPLQAFIRSFTVFLVCRTDALYELLNRPRLRLQTVQVIRLEIKNC